MLRVQAGCGNGGCFGHTTGEREGRGGRRRVTAQGARRTRGLAAQGADGRERGRAKGKSDIDDRSMILVLVRCNKDDHDQNNDLHAFFWWNISLS